MSATANTHSFHLSPELNGPVHAPPSSPSLQMPNVFVIPPEEEQSDNPPWCYFSAAQDGQLNLSTPPDFSSLDVALNRLQMFRANIPIFNRSSKDQLANIVMPKKAGETRSMDRFTPEEVADWEDQLACPSIPSIETGNDSVVVEIVKIKKSDVVADTEAIAASTLQRSKTFKSRASKAFKSLKNIGMATKRKPSAKEIWPPNPGTHSLPKQRPLPSSRGEDHSLPAPLSPGGATVLSQLFQSSINTSTEPQSSPASPTNVSCPDFTYSSRPEARASIEERPDSPATECGSDYATLRSPSPVHPSTKSFRRRLSVLDLRRFFSFSSASLSEPNQIPPSSCTMSVSSSPTSSMSRGASSSSEGGPETPVDDIHDAPLFPAIGWPGSLEDVIDTEGSKSRDISVEMRLDSLHFDSLSFDPESF